MKLLHILGLAHVQNRADRCNYIDVNTELIQVGDGRVLLWGEIEIRSCYMVLFKAFKYLRYSFPIFHSVIVTTYLSYC